jgi:hypothetical protein
MNPHNRTHHHQYSTPPSPCISLSDHFASTFSSLIAWNDSVQSPPAQHRRHQHQHQHQQKHSNNSTSELPLPSITVPSNYRPSVPRTVSPVSAQEQQRQQQGHQLLSLEGSRASTPPPLSVPPSPAPDSSPAQEDLVGRRVSAPKRRRITRAVQPLACYFCRGRKIACGPPTHSRSGDRTCEYVVTPLTLFSKSLFVFGGYFFCAKNIIRRTIHDSYIIYSTVTVYYTTHSQPQFFSVLFLFLSIFQHFLFFFSVVLMALFWPPRHRRCPFILFLFLFCLLFMSLCALMLMTHHLTFFSLLVWITGPARDVTSSANIQQNRIEAAEPLGQRRHP